MSRRIPVYATLLLAVFLVDRWFGTEWITETPQAVEAGRGLHSTGERASS